MNYVQLDFVISVWINYIISKWKTYESEEKLYFINNVGTFVYMGECNTILTLSQTSPAFYVFDFESFENTVGKGKIAISPFPQCFLPFWRIYCRFHQIWNCHLQTPSVRKSLKFVVWERVNIIRIALNHWFIMSCKISCKKETNNIYKTNCNKMTSDFITYML